MSNQLKYPLKLLPIAMGLITIEQTFAYDVSPPQSQGSTFCANNEISPNCKQPVFQLRLDKSLTLPSNEKTKNSTNNKQNQHPTFITGNQYQGLVDGVLTVEGNAEIRQYGKAIYADKISYDPKTDKLQATGNVKAYTPDVVITGPACELTLDTKIGYFDQAEFKLDKYGTRGNAQKLEFLPKNKIIAEEGKYTSCKPGNDDWYIKTGKLTLDQDQEKATIENGGTMVFKGIPIFYWPQYSIALGDKRASGFLIPQVRPYNSRTGFEIGLPYYWNIAPNYDAVITPKYLSRRGFQLGTEYRYLTENNNGIARGEFLPSDRIADRNRYSYFWQQTGKLNPNWSWNANIQGVSDSQYFTDFSNRIAVTSQTILPRELQLNYAKGKSEAFIRTNKYQTLTDIANPITPPYDLLPQAQYRTAVNNVYGFDASITLDATRFSHNTLIDGTRIYAYPSLSYPIVTSAFSFTPKVSLHSSSYSLGNIANTTYKKNIQRTVPIYSVDTGLAFEREKTNWFGKSATQTLEPRLYYLYAPFRDQSNIPNFDSALADFSLTQLFSENAYVGNDRIADANQLTMALTSRFLSEQDGQELFRATVARRQNFQAGRRVTLPGETAFTERASDILFGVNGLIGNNFYFDTAAQYNTQGSGIRNGSVGVRYQPDLGRVINLAYRYRANEYRLVDFSTQWRINESLSTVARVNYSINDKRYVESLLGMEYLKDCWTFRVVGQRFVATDGKATKSLSAQLEFNGLGKVGTRLDNLLSRSITGYANQKTHTTDPNKQALYE